MAKKMRVCVFCGTFIKGKRAKEHVYRNSWLKRLGHSKTETPMDFYSKENLIMQRGPVADQVQAGEICAVCNNGWMNDLDLLVEDVVLGMAKSEKIKEWPRLENAISFWLFKTAFAFSVTDTPARRHVPNAMFHALRNGELPKSYVTFIHHTIGDDHKIGACHLDAWPPGCEHLAEMEQHTRFKFAIQYNNVIFGCAYANWDDPTFVFKNGYHTLIEARGARVRFNTNTDIVSFNDSILPGKLNYILAMLGVE